jgi:hypothetical protein
MKSRRGPKKKPKPERRALSKSTSQSSRRQAPARHVDRLIETGGTVLLDLKFVRFAGVALGGGKTDKTAVAILEFYPDQRRVFLRSLREKITSTRETSADEVLISTLNDEEKDLAFISLDVPLQLPKCIRCQLKCPGVESCREPEIKWMREVHKNREKHKRPNKMFTPYTERAVEVYIANELEEPFHPSHAFGANAAPLTARAHFLSRRLTAPLSEVYPKLSLWRIGCALDIPKSHLRFHKHAVDSDEARLHILRTLIDRDIAFIYQQDLRLMVENNVCFEAFICALTGFLKYRGQTEKRPALFPKDELWIDFPKQKISWFD